MILAPHHLRTLLRRYLLLLLGLALIQTLLVWGAYRRGVDRAVAATAASTASADADARAALCCDRASKLEAVLADCSATARSLTDTTVKQEKEISAQIKTLTMRPMCCTIHVDESAP